MAEAVSVVDFVLFSHSVIKRDQPVVSPVGGLTDRLELLMDKPRRDIYPPEGHENCRLWVDSAARAFLYGHVGVAQPGNELADCRFSAGGVWPMARFRLV
nr:hypothetical protein [Kosakonia arachidis]